MAETNLIGKEVLIRYKEGVEHYDRFIPGTIYSAKKHSVVVDTLDPNTGEPIKKRVDWQRVYSTEGEHIDYPGTI